VHRDIEAEKKARRDRRSLQDALRGSCGRNPSVDLKPSASISWSASVGPISTVFARPGDTLYTRSLGYLETGSMPATSSTSHNDVLDLDAVSADRAWIASRQERQDSFSGVMAACKTGHVYVHDRKDWQS